MAALSRRRFLARGALAAPLAHLSTQAQTSVSMPPRVAAATRLRIQAAERQGARPLAPLISNGDEEHLPDYIGCYFKGLPQNQFGVVDPAAFRLLIKALRTGTLEDFERLPRGGGRTLSNPQCGLAFHMEGGDPQTFPVPPAPSIASAAAAPDIDELYWQALCRDVPFDQYATSPLIRKAAHHLGKTPATVFRSSLSGAAATSAQEPHVSQFLLRPIPYGAGRLDQRYNVPVAGSDFMTEFPEWTQLQAGFSPWREAEYDPVPRYIRNGRDLAEFVHYDFAYQAYLGAAQILINANARSIHNCNQFRSGNNPYRYSTVEDGFATFGPAEATDWLGRVTTAALKAAYYQKWSVHRRLRPEALGGLIHLTRTGARSYPLDPALLKSEAADAVFAAHGSYLLPQAYPEGSPLHPSYPSGHAAIAGACAVVLKVCFDGSMLLPGAVRPDAEGLKLLPCPSYSPTVNQEIDKLAFNVSMGRGWAGIHYRSDHIAGLLLGEAVAISIMQDLVRTYVESFSGLAMTKFDGTRVLIKPGGELT